jgi:long-chain acyl-CoA synthetase
MVDRQGRAGRVQPYDMSGIERDANGILRYVGLPRSLVALLRSSVERFGDREAVVELGGERLSYQELWWPVACGPQA